MARTVTSTTDSEEQMAEAMGVKPSSVAPDAKAAPAPDEAVTADVAADGSQDEKQTPRRATPLDEETQERVDRLTWERYQERSRREEAERRALELERQLQETRSGKAVGDDKRTADNDDEIVIKPYAEPRPKLDDFDTIEGYTDAIAEWSAAKSAYETEQRIEAKLERRSKRSAAQTEEERQAEATNRALTEHQGRINEFRKVVSDFDDVARRAIARGLPMTPTMNAHFIHSDMGPALMYHLATHEEECLELASLPPARQIARLGRLEERLEREMQSSTDDESGDDRARREERNEAPRRPSVPLSPKQLQTRKSSTPPKPPERVGGGRHNAPKDPGQMSFKEFKEWRKSGGGR